MKILMFVVIFLLVGAFFLISNNDLNISDEEERDVFMEGYYDWFFKVFDNSKSVTGYIVKMNWLP